MFDNDLQRIYNVHRDTKEKENCDLYLNFFQKLNEENNIFYWLPTVIKK